MIEGPVQYGRLDVGGAREYPEVGSIPAYKKDISVGTQRPAAQAAATYVRDSSRHCAL